MGTLASTMETVLNLSREPSSNCIGSAYLQGGAISCSEPVQTSIRIHHRTQKLRVAAGAEFSRQIAPALRAPRLDEDKTGLFLPRPAYGEGERPVPRSL